MLQYRDHYDMSGLNEILDFKDNVYDSQEITNQFLQELTIETEQLKIVFSIDYKQQLLDNFINKDLFVITFNQPKQNILDQFYQLSNNSNYLRQYFSITELQIDIAANNLVPHHELVNDQEEKDFVCRNMLCTINQLPVIKQSDPMARYIGAKLGDIVRILKIDPKTNCVEQMIYRAVLAI